MKNRPVARPVVYFKDFEKRFDSLLNKNKTPRNNNMNTMSTASPRELLPGEEVQEKPKPKFKIKKKPERPPTPVFFENFAPPKKVKKNTLAAKKRYKSQGKEDNVNLLQSILHSREPKAAKVAKKKTGTKFG